MTTLVVGIVGGIFFLAAGHCRPRFVQSLLRPGIGADLMHAIVNGPCLDVFIGRLMTVLSAVLGVHGAAATGFLARAPLWQQALVLVVAGDFLKWSTHRLQHAVPLLWRFHRLHHSSTVLDSLSHARSHPIEFLINRIPFLVLFVIVLGIDLRLVGVFSSVDLLQGLWAHSNTHWKAGWLNKVVATQEFHHWHHATDQEARDKNFGGFLSIWDWLLGTAYCPADRNVSGFGLPPEHAGHRYVDHLRFPFQ